MKDTDIAYIAGLIDGEGTVTLIRNRPNETKAPTISMTSTTKELLLFIQERFGGYIRRQKKYQEHHKDAWVWSVTRSKALELLSVVEPYMLEPKKKARARKLLDSYPSIIVKNGKYKPSQVAARNLFEKDFFEL